VWHEEMIVFLWRNKKITEASGPCLCRFAPNRWGILHHSNSQVRLMQAARRVVGLAAGLLK